MEYIIGVQSGISHRTDLFLIGKNGYSGVDRILCLNLRHQRCVCTHSVILTVSTDHTAVQTYVAGPMSRNQFYLGAEKISLSNSITFV